MQKLISVLLVLAMAIIIACGGDDEATPAATDEPTDGPSATATDGTDGGGEQTFSSSQLPITVTVTVPDGWEHPEDADLPDLFAVVNDPEAGWIDFLQPRQVYTYPSETESELGDPPADYVAWFNDNPFLVILGTEDVTIGGLPGTRLEITHDQDPFSLFKLSDGSDYHMSYLDHIYAHVLDAGGTQIIVSCGVGREGNFEEFATECEDVLETVEFGT